METKEIPMTEAMYYVLLALVHPNHGYQLMYSIKAVSNGRMMIGPGTLYGILTRMLKAKLVRIIDDDGRRKTYEITAAGQLALRTEYERLQNMVIDGRLLEGGKHE
jgi:DNA-binding PadR family transcriptional regulator